MSKLRNNLQNTAANLFVLNKGRSRKPDPREKIQLENPKKSETKTPETETGEEAARSKRHCANDMLAQPLTKAKERAAL